MRNTSLAVLEIVRSEQRMADLRRLAADRGISLAALSRRIDRNVAYLQQHVERGSPRRLSEDDRYVLARLLGVDERALGAREPWRL
jgi:hypothetical protein